MHENESRGGGDGRSPGGRTLSFEGRRLTPQEANRLLDLSFIFEVQERIEDAVGLYSTILAQYPLWADVHFRLGGAREAQGDLLGAEEAYGRALGLNRNYADARRKLGEVLMDQGRFDEALAHFEKLLQTQVERRYADVHNNLGVVHEQKGDLQEAESCYRQALEINPDFERARYNLANVLDATGRSAEAQGEYRRVLARNPQEGRALQNLAVSLANSGDLHEAARLLQELLETEPHNMLAWENLVSVFRDLNLPEKAAETEKQARNVAPLPLEELPFDLEAILRQASRDYAEVLERHPRWPDVHFKLGLVSEGLGRPEKALMCYHQALAINPDYVQAHRKLAELCFDLGRYDEAILEFQSVLDIRVTYRYADVQNNSGVAHEGLGDHDAARRAYRRALEINPHYSKARYNLGNTFMNQEDWVQAIDQYRLVLDRFADDTRALNNMGICLAQLNQNAEALEAFARRATLEPENPGAHFNLAQLYEVLENHDRAREHYQRVLELDPRHQEAAERLRDLIG